MKARIEIIADGLMFPEGPAFGRDGSLWAVELQGACLIKYMDGKLNRYHVGGKPNGLAIDKQGMIWFCDAGENAIRRFNPDNGESEVIVSEVDGKELSQPNDLVFDDCGNLLFTCPGNSRTEPTGYVCVWKPDHTVKKIITGKYFPNGLAFTKDGKNLIFAETYRHQLWKGEWDARNCEWLYGRVWCKVGGPVGPGGPDGIAFDEHGNLYVAVYGTGEIRVINPSGIWTDAISLAGQNPTNCTFDPFNRYNLIVTEAERGELLHIRTEYLNN